MITDAFKQREHALEAEFFHRVDVRLLAKLRSDLAAQSQCQRLAAATGIADESLLRQLVDVGVSVEALAALTLVPMVLVAWADGKLDDQERVAILESAQRGGMETDGAAYRLLSHWLDRKPSVPLANAWKSYLQVILANVNVQGRQDLCKQVVKRARRVAKASGGSMGLGKISAKEKQVLADLKQAFAGQVAAQN
jgi:hypothetical protein